MSIERDTPWWYGIPHVAVTLIVLSAVAAVLYVAVPGAEETRLMVALGVGLLAGLTASFLQGAAQQRHDRRR
ncbi:hypothetical protein [Streptomyces sp. NBC_00658]|uniref:hypothetical protein n=1 Tax=Streptomyces sp. NBC_00658 TaxID=2975800 RepID=UPI0032467904